MKYNNRGAQDARRVLSGKDGAIYDEEGNLLATITAFQAQTNITNATYNPLGDAQTHKHLLSYEVTLSMTETIIESSAFIEQLYETMETGIPCYWTFQATMGGWDGSEERVIFRDCVPDGQIDLQNAQVGELWIRTWNMSVNSPPELQSLLSYSD